MVFTSKWTIFSPGIQWEGSLGSWKSILYEKNEKYIRISKFLKFLDFWILDSAWSLTHNCTFLVMEFKLNYLITTHQKFQIFQIAAILVTGGSGARTSVEVLSGAGTPLCTLPPLPTGREYHTQDGLISCGGYDDDYIRTCTKLTTEGWVVSHNLLEDRYEHSSWQSPAGLVLIGGGYPYNTTELLSSSDSSSSYNFTLLYRTW